MSIDPKALEAAREIVDRSKLAQDYVWMRDAVIVARALLAGEGNSVAAGAGPFALLPCPFCGGTASPSIGKNADGTEWPYIECETLGCGAMAEPDAWNRRAGKDNVGEKAGLTQAARIDASPSSSPSPAVRDAPLSADIAQDAARYRYLREHCSYHYGMDVVEPSPAEWGIQWQFQQTKPGEQYETIGSLIDREIEQVAELADEDDDLSPLSLPEGGKP